MYIRSESRQCLRQAYCILPFDPSGLMANTDCWQCLHFKHHAIGCKHRFCENCRRDVCPGAGRALGVRTSYHSRPVMVAHTDTESPKSLAVSAAAACLSCLSSFAISALRSRAGLASATIANHKAVLRPSHLTFQNPERHGFQGATRGVIIRSIAATSNWMSRKRLKMAGAI